MAGRAEFVVGVTPSTDGAGLGETGYRVGLGTKLLFRPMFVVRSAGALG